MKPSRLNQQGYSLLEVLVATGIIGIIIAAAASFEVSMFKSIDSVKNKSNLVKILLTLQEDVGKDARFLANRPSSTVLEGASVTDTQMESLFSGGTTDVTLVQKCYDIQGAKLTVMDEADPTCVYSVKYFKMAMRDLANISNAAFADLPVSRIFIRLRFVEKNEVKIRYFSRMLTNTVVY